MTGGVGLPERVRELAAVAPDTPAVVDADGTATTWAELDRRADEVAERVAAGTVVAFEAVACAASIARIVGVLRAGGVAAPLGAGMTPSERSSARRLLAEHSGPPGTDLIVLTSGTTGRPKGVAHSAAGLAASADAWRAVLPPADGWVLALGLGHVAGLGVLWRAIADGVPIRIVPANDAAALAEALLDPAMTHVSLVPTQLVRLLDHVADAPPPGSLRAIPLGGGAIPVPLVERATSADWPVVPTYGLSEMGSGVTALPVEEAAGAPWSAGRAMPGMAVSIGDPDADGVGEIIVAGPSAFLGYLGGAPRTAGEPFRTGDLGRLGADGRLVVVDRRTDRIVRGGENIAPAEVEAVLAAHQAIADVGVVARREASLGQVPVAAIVLRTGVADPGDVALAAHARAHLAGFKVPASFVRLDVLPRGASGKLRRAELRALLDDAPEGQMERPDGDRIGWRISGSGPRPIILLHGTLSWSRQLDALAAQLADVCGATVHALDRRGSGTGRLARPRPIDVGVHVADILAYLDVRGIERAVLVGVSFGGVVGLETAARAPERVASVAAYEPPYGAVMTPAMGVAFPDVAGGRLEAAFERGGAAAAAELFLRAVAGDAAWERLSSRSRAVLGHEGTGALADAALAGLDPEGLARIAAPVLLITGGSSEPFYTPIADELARRIPSATRATLEGLAHTAPIVRPQPVVDAIRAFLESVPA